MICVTFTFHIITIEGCLRDIVQSYITYWTTKHNIHIY
jgi:hypothetical protein